MGMGAQGLQFRTEHEGRPPAPPDVLDRGVGSGGKATTEFRASGGVISTVPKLPAANGHYTPAQRRSIDAELREAEKGPFYGPFDTADEMIAHLKGAQRFR